MKKNLNDELKQIKKMIKVIITMLKQKRQVSIIEIPDEEGQGGYSYNLPVLNVKKRKDFKQYFG